MRPLADLHEQVVDVDAEREVGVHERQHGRRRHDGGRPPRQDVCVAGECRGHGTYTDHQEALDNKCVVFVDGDVTLNKVVLEPNTILTNRRRRSCSCSSNMRFSWWSIDLLFSVKVEYEKIAFIRQTRDEIVEILRFGLCMHVCIYVCMYVCMHACTHARTRLCMYVCRLIQASNANTTFNLI